MLNKKYITKTLLLLFKVAVSLFFIWFVFSKIDLNLLKGYLKGTDYRYLVLAFVTLVAGGFAGAASWWTVLRSGGFCLTYRKVCVMHWCGMFFNSFLPSNIGGDLYKGVLLIKGSQSGTAKAAASILLDRIINFSVLVLIGLLSFCFAFGHFEYALLTAAAAASSFYLVRLFALKHKAGGRNRIIEFVLSMLHFSHDHRNCALAFFAALFSQGLKVGCHIFLILALDLDMSLNTVWYVIPLFGIISALPISLGGIGIRELVAIWLVGPTGVAQEELVALSLVSHLLFISVNCMGFIPFMMLRKQRRIENDEV